MLIFSSVDLVEWIMRLLLERVDLSSNPAPADHSSKILGTKKIIEKEKKEIGKKKIEKKKNDHFLQKKKKNNFFLPNGKHP